MAYVVYRRASSCNTIVQALPVCTTKPFPDPALDTAHAAALSADVRTDAAVAAAVTALASVGADLVLVTPTGTSTDLTAVDASGAPITAVAAQIDYQVTGLAANTTYEFRLTGVNAVGEGAPGPASVSVLTLPAAVSDPPTALRTVSSGFSSVQVDWRAPADSQGHPVSSFLLQRTAGKSLDPDAAVNSAAVVAADTAAAAVFDPGMYLSPYRTTYLFQGLRPSTMYRFRVSAFTSVGQSAYSDEAVALTTSAPTSVGVPPAAPSGVRVVLHDDLSLSTPAALRVSWEDLTSPLLAVSHYTIFFRLRETTVSSMSRPTNTPRAAALLGDIGTTTVPGTLPRTGQAVPVGENIYGPMEAGFGPSQDNVLRELGCTIPEQAYLRGGIDTETAEQVIAHSCGVHLPREGDGGTYVSLVDECGGHTSEYHFHERLSCLYDDTDGSVTGGGQGGHSPQVGVAMEPGQRIYGKWENQSAGLLPKLDACGGHFGPTPESGEEAIYHYHVQPNPPFTVGCFGPDYDVATGDPILVTLSRCRDLYRGCTDSSSFINLETSTGVSLYAPWCPCFDGARSNTGSAQLPVFAEADGSSTAFRGSGGAQPAIMTTTVTDISVTPWTRWGEQLALTKYNIFVPANFGYVAPPKAALGPTSPEITRWLSRFEFAVHGRNVAGHGPMSVPPAYLNPNASNPFVPTVVGTTTHIDTVAAAQAMLVDGTPTEGGGSSVRNLTVAGSVDDLRILIQATDTDDVVIVNHQSDDGVADDCLAKSGRQALSAIFHEEGWGGNIKYIVISFGEIPFDVPPDIERLEVADEQWGRTFALEVKSIWLDKFAIKIQRTDLNQGWSRVLKILWRAAAPANYKCSVRGAFQMQHNLRPGWRLRIVLQTLVANVTGAAIDIFRNVSVETDPRLGIVDATMLDLLSQSAGQIPASGLNSNTSAVAPTATSYGHSRTSTAAARATIGGGFRNVEGMFRLVGPGTCDICVSESDYVVVYDARRIACS